MLKTEPRTWAIPPAPRKNLRGSSEEAERPLETIIIIWKIFAEVWTTEVKKELKREDRIEKQFNDKISNIGHWSDLMNWEDAGINGGKGTCDLDSLHCSQNDTTKWERETNKVPGHFSHDFINCSSNFKSFDNSFLGRQEKVLHFRDDPFGSQKMTTSPKPPD
jgi:hypothetical protein